ncbi:MAG: DUF4113 domain-containing protein [Methylococcaceae bacterium]|nr:DUF4113 domain-containing protein [Methylococcaceae bacterium]
MGGTLSPAYTTHWSDLPRVRALKLTMWFIAPLHSIST